MLDISERMKAEEALFIAEARFRLAFDSAAIGMALASMDGHFIQVNQALCWLVGYSQEELLQMKFQDITYPDDLAADLACSRKLIGGERISYQLEKRYIHKDGHLVWTLLSASVFMDEQAGQPYFIKQIQDISERKAAVEQLKELNDTLDQRVKDEVAKNRDKEHMLIQQSRLAAMGEMIGNIAHQWRQPLNALGLLLANLKDTNDFGELDTPQIEASVAKGTQLINKMSTTIDDFRNFFKPNKVKESFSLDKSLQEALNLLSHSLKNNNISVQVESNPDALVFGFPNEFSQVLLNILNNAKDAILQSKVARGVIEVKVGRDAEKAWIVVKDNAGGIPADILPRIFDPYFTTKEKGTGIGLYMSKMIIEDHMDGKIEARNVGDGAEFMILCPMSEPSAS